MSNLQLCLEDSSRFFSSDFSLRARDFSVNVLRLEAWSRLRSAVLPHEPGVLETKAA